ncbi:DUF881 domain-containing protein [Mycolicibacterium mengxianglii]|uniref:DUF881 domain-containing protein n=1 Tax=Mycolicibacterium mengxianglii TaxID=2736649 RepID=UPI0018EEFE41|nr:DUF881 domain-containing protein [Mycolicibacterium mengxianglii]
MREPDRTLGGFEPAAGLSPRQVHAVQKLPVPSLLRSLLSEHLDPGYAAAAKARADSPHPPPRMVRWGWQATAALLIAMVFAVAAAQARTTAPGVSEAQHVLAGSVRAAEGTTDGLADRRDTLAAEVDDIARRQLADDAEGQQLLTSLDEVNLPAASTPMIGPGVTVTVTDPGMGRDLTDVSKQRVPGSRQVILDRDLQLVVNSLWAAGAEAIAIDGIRMGPNVTIRQAGGAILVDNHPTASPYVIVALGPPNALRDGFDRSPGLIRLRLLEASYGVGATVSADEGLTVPTGATREIKFAKQMGP